MTAIEQRMAELGDLVRALRRAAGLTQVRLADLAGVGKTSVHDIEKGKTTVRMDTLFAVLRVLNVGVHFSGPLQQQMALDPVMEPENQGSPI